MNFLKYPALIVLVVVSQSCNKNHKSVDAAAAPSYEMKTTIDLNQEQVKAAGITIGKPELREISGVIKVNGVLDVPPQNLVSISAPMGGFVKHTDLLQGMKIQKGQPLVELEGQDYIQLQEEYLTNKSQLEFLQLDYDRQLELSKENVNAAKALQLAKSNYLSTKASVEGLSAKLRMIHIDPGQLESGSIKNSVTVSSPISGYVSQVNINLGMHVNPTDVMFRIIDTEHLHAEAQVFEKDLNRLHIGQKVRVMLTNDTKERIATVFLIGREVAPDRTVRVHCHFEGEDVNLIPGMFFSAVIETENNPVTSLPESAIVTFEGKKFIFTAGGNSHFEMKEIKVGASQSGYAEVTLPDSASAAAIVTHGAYELLSRLKNSEK